MTVTTTQAPSVTMTMEREIRGFAAGVLNAVNARETHPTFGYTKTGIRNNAQRMEGAIGLFGVVTEQVGNTMVPERVQFFDITTTDLVTRAREAVKSL